MSFFKPRVSFWNFLAETLRFRQKEPIKVQVFRFFSALMKVHPIPHASFETTRSMRIQILHHCSVSWKITPLYFLSQTFILWTKTAHRSEIFKLLSGWVKTHQILYVIFETISQFFFKFCITLQCLERQLFCTFLAETTWFGQKDPVEMQNSFRLLT